jgi:uncharacterized protein (TIGR00255 family)
MRPIGRALLDQAHGTGGARPVLEGQVQPDAHHLLMGTAERQVQESERIEQRLRGMPERLEQGLEGDLGRARTFGVAAHAVHDHQQHGMLGDGHRNPVLVLLATPEETQIGVFNLQGIFCLSGTLWAILYHAERWRHQTCSRPPRGPNGPQTGLSHQGPSMIASMTGFARRETSGPWGSLICELRSVNHRFLESSLRLPEELRSLDPEIRQQFGRGLKRGKVDCTFTYRRTDVAARALDLDREALEQLLGRAREVAALAGSTPVSIDALEALRWPGVIRDTDTGTQDLLVAARALAAATVDDLAQARAREGARLGELIEQRCALLTTLVAQVRARLPEVRIRTRARLDERLAELKAEVDQERLEQELALLLQRLDVDEELDRLGSHVEEIRRIIASSEPAGRRLDFLMQELNREANTLSSKSQDLETTRAAVDMKVLIEQLREQVQNIE